MGAFGVIFAIAVVGFIIVAAVVSHQQAKKRREELAAFAVRNGLSFSPANNSSYDERYSGFDCLKQGSNRYAYNILAGSLADGDSGRGRSFCAFDYHYETHSTNSKGQRQTHHHYFSAVIVSSEVPLKSLVIRPETFGDKLAGFFGWDDIDFESAEFSRKFHVKAPDRRWAYDVIHTRTMEFLLEHSGFSMQFDTDRVIIWTGRTWDVAQIQRGLFVVNGVLDRLPDYVVQQQRDTQGQ